MKFLEFVRSLKLNEQEEETWFDVSGNPSNGDGENLFGYDEGGDDEGYDDEGGEDDYDQDYDDDRDEEHIKSEVNRDDVEEVLEDEFPDREWELTDEDITEVIRSFGRERPNDLYSPWEDIVSYMIDDIRIHKEMKK